MAYELSAASAAEPVRANRGQPLPEVGEAMTHLNRLAPDEENFIFVSFVEDPARKAQVPANTCAGSLNDHMSWIKERQRNGCGVYVTVQAMTAKRRRNDDVGYIRAVFGEFDRGLPNNLPLEPSLITETSPGRYHAYWFTDPNEAITPDDFKSIMECMVATYGSDPNAKDLSRVLRLAGTWNQKPGRPQHLVRIIHDVESRYGRAEFIRHFPAPKRTVKPPSRIRFDGLSTNLARFVEPLKAIPADTYHEWVEIGQALHHESSGSSTGLAMWDDWSRTSNKYRDGECDAKWKGFRTGGGITGGSIYAMAERSGWTKPVKTGPTPTTSSATDRAAGASNNEQFDPEHSHIGAPKISGPAMSGITGDIVKLATRDSEADPVAVAMSNLVWAGAMFGRSRCQWIGDDEHHGRIFAAIVGDSAVARKGTSMAAPRRIWGACEEYLSADSTRPFPLGHKMKIGQNLSSGEGLVYEIRDPSEEELAAIEDEDAKAALRNYQRDKRILIIEHELAGVFRQKDRSGNTLSVFLRQAWDGRKLAPMTKTSRVQATDPHVCLIGHITRGELSVVLGETDILNGLANRMLWIYARRPKLVPLPKPIPADEVKKLGKELAQLTLQAHSRQGEIALSQSAEDLWLHVYPELSQEHRGVVGSLLARGPAYVRRLAQVYAMLDGKESMTSDHLEAALALWRYSSDSAKFIFGEREVDEKAQKILDFLAEGPRKREDIRSDCLQRRVLAPDLDRVLADLVQAGRIAVEPLATKGRPASVYRRIF